MFNIPLALLHYVILVVVMAFVVLRKREQQGGQIVLKTSFLVAFATGAIMTFSTALYTGVLYSVDPERKLEIISFQRDLFIDAMQERGVQQENIDKAVEMRDSQTDTSNNIGDSFFNWIKDLVIVAVIAVILGLVIKTSRVNLNLE